MTVRQDARFFALLDEEDRATVQLTDATGNAVDIALEPAGDSNGIAYWVVPANLLPVGSYTLHASSPGRAVRDEQFTVSAGLASTPPMLEELQSPARFDRVYCQPYTGVVVDWTVGAGARPLVLEIEVWRGSVLLGRTFPASSSFDFNTATTQVVTSTGPECFGTSHLPGIELGDHLTLRARVWDTSGNASETREVEATAHYAGEPDCAHWCSATPGRAQPSAASLITVAALGGLCLARRRRAKARG